MFNKFSTKLLFIGFIALIFTSGIHTDHASIYREWGELNSKYSFDLDKQSFCFKENGKLLGENIDSKIRPASVTKLYTSFWVLEELGHDYRFQTHFIYENDSLYILGVNDSYLVNENMILILDHLNKNNITHVKNIYFDHHFYLNWKSQPAQVRMELKNILNTNQWTRSEDQSFLALNDYLFESSRTQIIKPDFHVENIKFTDNIQVSFQSFDFIHYSSPLYQQLKPINMYSNNFYTDNLFNFIGGELAFSDFMYREFNATEDSIKFYTGSGLGENYTTCRLTLDLLTHLNEELDNLNLKPYDIMPVAGVDKGTLQKRFTESKYHNIITAKTGTLRHTSALAGYINGEEELQFGLFNHTYNTQGARELQNQFIKKFINDYAETEQHNYLKKAYPSIRNSYIE